MHGTMYEMKHFYKILCLSFTLATITCLPQQTLAQEPTVYEKAEQMIIIGFRGSSVKDTGDVFSILQNINVGGLIFFDYDTGTKSYNRNIKTGTAIRPFITAIKNTAQTPLFLSIDEEGGKVSRLKKITGYGKTNSTKSIATLSSKKIQDIFTWRANKITTYGFNMNFAPVLDLCYPGTIMSKQERCFSNNPSRVASLAISFAETMKKRSVIPVYKHYPGIGSGIIDTHTGAADITTTHTENDYVPFKTTCSKDSYPVIMISHVHMTAVDTLPASLSKKHIDTLRTLGCSHALLISDDMDMGAISDTYTLTEILEKSINAGVDMLIFSNNIRTYDKDKYLKIQSTLKELIDSGALSKERIESSYKKIIKYKKEFKIM